MTELELKKLQAIIEKGVPYSSFGDAAEYQRRIRKDRKLPFRDPMAIACPNTDAIFYNFQCSIFKKDLVT